MNRPPKTADDDWNEPFPEYAAEYERCPHGVAPKWECDWCRDERRDEQ